jgi:hypothetical protein
VSRRRSRRKTRAGVASSKTPLDRKCYLCPRNEPSPMCPEWMPQHAKFMSWSYVGLLAAFVAEVAVRVPGVGFGSAVIAATAFVVAGGAVLIRTRVPRILVALTKPARCKWHGHG